MSDAKKGKMPKFIPNNKGRVHSKESRMNMSLAHKGKKLTEENKKKIGEANIGKHFKTREWKMKMSRDRTGSKNPMYGVFGASHPQWKGGVTPENHRIRMSLEMKLWRKSCMERDDFTCQKTGERGGKLVVHHINNFADFPELRTSITNGITLSKESHQEFHKKYGKRNNTREQLNEFLQML